MNQQEEGMSDKNENICSCSDNEVKLIFACSGGADVWHLSDLAARQMMKDIIHAQKVFDEMPPDERDK